MRQMDFRDKILKICDAKHWEITSLATEAEIPYGTLLSYVDRRGRTPPVGNGIRIARALGVSADWLWDDEKSWSDSGRERGDDDDRVARLREALDYLGTVLYLEIPGENDQDEVRRADTYVANAMKIAYGVGARVRGERAPPIVDGQFVYEHDLEDHDRSLYVPILGSVAAGPPLRSGDGEYPPGIAEEYVLFESKDPHCFACHVLGDSMEPRFQEGDVVICEPSRSARDGDACVVVLKRGDEHLVKVLRGKRLFSMSPKYAPVELRASDEPRVYPIVARFPRHSDRTS